MKEVEKRTSSFRTEILRPEEADTLDALAIEYATSFWAGTWQELLIDPTGRQYGTFGQNGEIYPETLALLTENNLSAIGSWPLQLWQLAGEGKLFSGGLPLKQFWSLDKAKNELLGFLTEIEAGGFGGEILLLKDGAGQIAGFTAYTAGLDAKTGPTLAQKRFPYQKLVLPETESPVEQTLEALLGQLFPGKKIGVYLDFAISENRRGQGLGSRLFDMRLDRLVELGAEVIVGRTIKTSPAQYYGNYTARGMKPIAFDPTNPDKAIFAVETLKIKTRNEKTKRN